MAATLRTIFAQPRLASARDTVERVGRLFEERYPKPVKLLREAETDIRADFGFRGEHRRQIWSTNSVERLNKGSRAPAMWSASFRAGSPCGGSQVLEEQNDEWAVGRRYLSTESMNKL